MSKANDKPQALFVDFDGTLTNGRFWETMQPEIFGKINSFLFGQKNPLVDKWLRGQVCAEYVTQAVADRFQLNYDELWANLVHDCENRTFKKNILPKLRTLRDQMWVVMMTDNMDVLSRFTVPGRQLDLVFHRIVSSHETGRLKKDRRGLTLWKTADELGLSPKECVLIDDSRVVCELFDSLGGRYLHVFPGLDLARYLDDLRNTIPASIA